MTTYAQKATAAHRLLAKSGMTMTLTRPSSSEPTYDSATGVATPVAPLTYTVTGVKFEYSARERDGSLIQTGDQRVYLSTTGAVLPLPGDTLTIGSTVFRVVRTGAISPAGVDVLYDLQVRK